jgi:hypothetical protein
MRYRRSDVLGILSDKFKSGEIPEPNMWANDILDILERRVKMMPPYCPEESFKMLPSGEMIYGVYKWEPEYDSEN